MVDNIQIAREGPAVNYEIEEINADNHRPGMPEEGFLVRYRPHANFGWTGRRCFGSRELAEEFAGTLTPAGDLPG